MKPRRITRKRANETPSRLADRLLDSIMQFSPLLISVFDLQGRFLAVSASYQTTLGVSKDEIIGKTFGDFLPPATAETFMERLDRLKQTQSLLEVEDIVPVRNIPRSFTTKL